MAVQSEADVSRTGAADTAAPALTWREVVEALPVMAVVLDRDGMVMGVNRAWRDFAGSVGGPAQAVEAGSEFLRVYGPMLSAPSRDTRDILTGMREVLAGRRDEVRHEYACEVDGERRWYLLIASPLATGHGAVVCHVDISGHRRTEQNLRQRAADSVALAGQLQQINEELDQFAYIASHDLKAPLRGIANLSRWIEEDMGERFTPEAHEQMEMLRGRVERMESLIDGLLQYSRVGRVFTHIETIDVGKLLAEVIDLLSPPPGFRVEIEGPMPVVRGERLRLQQVFLNLIANAIKHHHRDDGRITIGVEDAGAYWRFSVADDGPGIAPAYHGKVFVIFQTLVARDEKEAAGVGLSLVKKIVEEQGGSVEIRSDQGAGATFRFTWAKYRTEHPEHA